jgi:hypothetical protein
MVLFLGTMLKFSFRLHAPPIKIKLYYATIQVEKKAIPDHAKFCDDYQQGTRTPFQMLEYTLLNRRSIMVSYMYNCVEELGVIRRGFWPNLTF